MTVEWRVSKEGVASNVSGWSYSSIQTFLLHVNRLEEIAEAAGFYDVPMSAPKTSRLNRRPVTASQRFMLNEKANGMELEPVGELLVTYEEI